MPEVNIPGVGLVHFPYDMPPEQIAAQAQRMYAEAQGKEPPLTRERRAPGAPSAMSAGHHPESARTIFGKTVPGIEDVGPDDLPSDAAFLKRAPEVGGAAGMMLGGPLGAGAGAAAGSLVKGQFERGAHVPTRSDLGDAAKSGGKTLAISAVPGLSMVAGSRLGPALANNAPTVSRGLSALTGIGAGVASGNPITGVGTSVATRMLTSPGAIRSAGNAVTRAAVDVPMHAVNKAGFGAISAEAFRQALLDALGAESPASAVP
jgi:hypothetical protein